MEYIKKDEVLSIINKDNYKIVDIPDSVAKSCIIADIKRLNVYKGKKKSEIVSEYFKRLERDKDYIPDILEQLKELDTSSKNKNNKENKFCPDDCCYLLLNEDEQNEFYENMNWRQDHLCSKYKDRLVHGYYHPKLLRLEECDEL